MIENREIVSFIDYMHQINRVGGDQCTNYTMKRKQYLDAIRTIHGNQFSVRSQAISRTQQLSGRRSRGQ